MALADRAEAADYYMVAQNPASYVFMSDGEISVPESGIRAARAITVFEGSEAIQLGYKILIQDLRFSCNKRTLAVANQATFASDGQRLTQGGASPAKLIKPNTSAAKEFAFVCEDQRTFADYYQEDPILAADQLYALLHAPRG